MADIHKMFGYDKKMAEGGAKMVIGDDPETEYILVCKANNPKYNDTLALLFQSHADALMALEASNPAAHRELDKQLTAEAQAKSLVVGFGPGLTNNGKPIPDTWEARQEILTGPSDIRMRCIEFSNDPTNYKPVLNKEHAKK